ncbi:TIGR01621 family pseudouridine synthase [Motiliproteus sediminis]|uniref:TIGR01621 family pseudouridine synthase n=1 Tax=Motiliproteus sediminis TaxID=1468178 RepID=UPI001FE5A403|nr:TIGR01621 family pseudouridine synthase [Motiliproteus sediminis]
MLTSEPFRLIEMTPGWLVVDKSAGVGFHREGATPGLLEYVAAATGDTQLYPVHRIDRMTSGLLLIARNPVAAAHLSRLFAERRVDKFYLALGARKPRKKQGRIVGDMTKGRGGSWRLLRSRENPSITDFESQSVGPGERLYLLAPRTGRTHQLRVAMKSLGAAIIGDPRYGSDANSEQRGYLHAYALCFELDGEIYRYLCPPTQGERFTTAAIAAQLANWGEPWSRFKESRREW